MKKYIGIEGNKLRMKAEMEEPERWQWWYDGMPENQLAEKRRKHESDKQAYEAHLASLPVIQAEFEVEVGREYVEYEHFAIWYHIPDSGGNYYNFWDVQELPMFELFKPVALPISKQEASPGKQIDYYEKDGKRWIREDLVRDTIMMEFVKKLVDDGRLRITEGNDEYFASRGIKNLQASFEVSKEVEQWLQVPISQLPPQDDWYCLVAQKSPLLTWAMPVVCWYEKENGWDIPTIAKGHTHYVIPKSLAATHSPSPTIKLAEALEQEVKMLRETNWQLNQQLVGAIEFDLQRLYDWLMDKNRKPAITAFTSGLLRNIASEIELRDSKPGK